VRPGRPLGDLSHWPDRPGSRPRWSDSRLGESPGDQGKLYGRGRMRRRITNSFSSSSSERHGEVAGERHSGQCRNGHKRAAERKGMRPRSRGQPRASFILAQRKGEGEEAGAGPPAKGRVVSDPSAHMMVRVGQNKGWGRSGVVRDEIADRDGRTLVLEPGGAFGTKARNGFRAGPCWQGADESLTAGTRAGGVTLLMS